MMKTIDAFEILQGYGLITGENKFSLTMHYYDPDFPHSAREVTKSTPFFFKKGQSVDILQLIRNTAPPNLNIRHVYAFIGSGKHKLLVFDDSSFICACILHLQNQPNADVVHVYIDHCASEFDKPKAPSSTLNQTSVVPNTSLLNKK